jgi:hypothetical protein
MRRASGRSLVVVAPEVADRPQRDAGREHAFGERRGGGLPVPAAQEAVLGGPAGEEVARQQDRGHRERRDRRDESAASLQLRRQRLQPAPPARGRPERKENQVLREHPELEVELLAADRKGEVGGK